MRQILVILITLPFITFGQIAFETIGNNVELRVNANGTLGIDLETLSSRSNIPGSDFNYLKQAGIWIVAEDYDGNYYTSVQHVKGKDSFDFWPGPADTLTGQTDPPDKWNKVWKITRADVEDHKSNYLSTGYTPSKKLLEWPAQGKNGFNEVLAPYIDVNNNKVYDPQNGDYPYLRGDEMVYCIFNDLAEEHNASLGQEIGVEVYLTAFTSSKASWEAKRTIFLDYYIVPRTSKEYISITVGFFLEGDLGSNRSVINRTELSTPGEIIQYKDSKLDKFLGVSAVFLNESLDGSMAFDNEKENWPMKYQDYANYMQSKWPDNSPLTAGNDGKNGTKEVKHIFSDIFANWNDKNVKTSRKSILGYSNYGQFKPGDVLKFNVGLAVDSILEFGFGMMTRDLYREISSTGLVNVINSAKLYPNPSNGIINLESDYIIKNVIIKDLHGKIVISDETINSQKHRCNISLAPGVYIVTLLTDQGISTKKLIINL